MSEAKVFDHLGVIIFIPDQRVSSGQYTGGCNMLLANIAAYMRAIWPAPAFEA